MMPLLFVYGTLKRGLRLHHHLEGCALVGTAVTAPGYALYEIDWYPALVPEPGDSTVRGEVYEVPEAVLEKLDEVEGVPYLYLRGEVEIRHLNGRDVRERCAAYVYQQSIDGKPRVPGGEWLRV